jgi:hypothetical protein
MLWNQCGNSRTNHCLCRIWFDSHMDGTLKMVFMWVIYCGFMSSGYWNPPRSFAQRQKATGSCIRLEQILHNLSNNFFCSIGQVCSLDSKQICQCQPCLKALLGVKNGRGSRKCTTQGSDFRECVSALLQCGAHGFNQSKRLVMNHPGPSFFFCVTCLYGYRHI